MMKYLTQSKKLFHNCQVNCWQPGDLPDSGANAGEQQHDDDDSGDGASSATHSAAARPALALIDVSWRGLLQILVEHVGPIMCREWAGGIALEASRHDTGSPSVSCLARSAVSSQYYMPVATASCTPAAMQFVPVWD